MMNPLLPRLTLKSKTLLIALLLSADVVSAATNAESLYLSVSVNGFPIDGYYEVIKQNEKLSIMAIDAEKLNVRMDDMPASGDYIELKPVNGFSYIYDDLNQTLLITADPSRLKNKQNIKTNSDARFLSADQYSPSVNGAAVNYSLFASRNEGNEQFTAFSELRTFGMGEGTFSSSFNSKFYQKNRLSNKSGTTRLMTNWRRDDVEKLLSFTLGDSYTARNSWSNSVRFGGISIAHNYTMQPGVNTTSRDILTDTVAMPSTVDLYIQGIKTASQQVSPGQFTLNTAPILSGNSSAQVVITDINGQQRMVNLDLYGTNKLLTRGLNLWEANVGWVRKDYGSRSFSYQSEFIGVADWRSGVTNQLTMESHTEQGQHLNNIGTGMNYLLSPSMGIMHADLAWGRYQQDSGIQWGAGWQWNNRYLSVGLNHTQRGKQYRDITALANNILPRQQDSAFVNLSIPYVGSLGTSWIRQAYSQQTSEYVGLTWSKSFSESGTITATFSQSLNNERDKTFYLGYSLPLFSNRNYLSLRHNAGSHSRNNQLSLSRSLESNQPGWGWNASARSGKMSSQHASLQRRNSWSDMALGTNQYPNQHEYYASMSGSVGFFMGSLYATRELGEAFLLVDTNGQPNVPVQLDHRPAGKTDSRGRLFLTNLVPNHPNSIDIDILDLPEDYRAAYTRQVAIPRSKSGVFTKFDVYQTRALLLSVFASDGSVIPAAAEVQVRDKDGNTPTHGTLNTIVGYEGEVYLEDPPPGGYAEINWAGEKCKMTLPASGALNKTSIRSKITCQ